MYALATPEEVTKTGIVFSHNSHDLYRTIEQLEKWAGIAVLFEKAKTIVDLLSSISIKDGDTFDPDELKGISNRLFLSAARSYIEQENWTEYDILLNAWLATPNCNTAYYSSAVIEAAHHSIHTGDTSRATAFLTKIKEKKEEWKYSDFKKMRIASLLYKMKADQAEVKDWIRDIPQPELKRNTRSTPRI